MPNVVYECNDCGAYGSNTQEAKCGHCGSENLTIRKTVKSCFTPFSINGVNYDIILSKTKYEEDGSLTLVLERFDEKIGDYVTDGIATIHLENKNTEEDTAFIDIGKYAGLHRWIEQNNLGISSLENFQTIGCIYPKYKMYLDKLS